MTLILKFSFSLLIVLFALNAKAADHVVKMKSISYDPKILVIKAGDTVSWVNDSYTPHSATADVEMANTDKFDTAMVEPKKSSKPILFSKPGAYSYHCSLHGKSMSARIEVQK